MAYVKKNLTPEQRAAIGRYAASCRKHFNGGRKKGGKNRSHMEPTRTLSAPVSACETFAKLAGVQHMTTCGFLGRLAEMLRQANPAVFEAPVRLPIDGVAAAQGSADADGLTVAQTAQTNDFSGAAGQW